MTHVAIKKVDEVFVRLECEPGYRYEIADKFSFYVKNYFFMPAYKSGVWDGTISMVDRRNGLTYWGLVPDILEYCKSEGYAVDLDPAISNTLTADIGDTAIQKMVDSLKISTDPKTGQARTLRDYQFESVKIGINYKKTIVLSPTASGKSMAIYCMAQYLKNLGRKVLIVVPNLSLIAQLQSDFVDYARENPAINVEAETHKIFGGQDKNTDKPIVISTWQSLQNMKPSYFSQYTALICDEVHGADAKQLTKIIQNMSNSTHRIGFTGTLKDDNISEVQLKGLFGLPHQVETTKNLQDRGILAKSKVRVLILTYPESEAAKVRGMPYHAEIDYLVSCNVRNNFIAKLAVNSKGNTMILFRLVEKHGKPLHTLVEQLAQGKKKTFYVSGEVEAEDRELIRKIMDTERDAVTTASFKVFGVGTNIVNLDNLILAAPTKSKVALLQAIGRALRKGSEKTHALIVDIVDNFPSKAGKSGKNYSAKHFQNRLDIYTREGFEVEFFEIPLNASNFN